MYTYACIYMNTSLRCGSWCVCVCVCFYVHICICILCVHEHKFALWILVRGCMCMHAFVCAYMYVYIYIYIYIYLHVYHCMYACMYVCNVCIMCMYICMHSCMLYWLRSCPSGTCLHVCSNSVSGYMCMMHAHTQLPLWHMIAFFVFRYTFSRAYTRHICCFCIAKNVCCLR